MTPELWKKVSEAWEEYFNLPPESRPQQLEQLRGADAQVAAELETLLKQHDGSDNVALDAPPSTLIERAGQSRSDAEASSAHPLDSRLRGNDARQSDGLTVDLEGDSSFAQTNTNRRLPDDVPARAGRYIIEEKIGEGGMGAVLRVRDPDFDRTLAVKIMSAKAHSDADAQRRFLEEAKLTGQLQHPGIPPVHEIGRLEDGLPFFSMKLIRGATLSSLLKARVGCVERTDSTRTSDDKGAFHALYDLPRFIGIFGQICQTIGYAHSRGVIHRDLKPANIMVGAFGEVQVMDWGLAKVVSGQWSVVSGSETSESAAKGLSVVTSEDSIPADEPRTMDYELRTRAGVAMGTPAYMAPEQARGEIAEIDARSDVFGLGAILCQILIDQPPFTGDTLGDVLDRATRGNLAETLERLHQCGADAELIDLTKHCLAPDKTDRPKDGGEVAGAIENYEAKVQERLRRAELDKAQAEVQAQEEQKRFEVVRHKHKAERQRNRFFVSLIVVTLVAMVFAVTGIAFYNLRLREFNKQLEEKVEQAEKARKKAKEQEQLAVAARKKADEQKNLADAQAGIAKAQALKAQTTSEFTLSLFEASDPLGLRGFSFYAASGGSKKLTAVDILTRGAVRIEKELKAHPDVRAAQMNMIGSVYGSLGDFKAAEALLEKAYKIRLQFFGAKDHQDVAESLNNLGWLYHQQGRFLHAKQFYEKALQMRESVLGKEHRKVTDTMFNMAWLLIELDEAKETEQILRKVIARRQKQHGGKYHHEVAVAKGLLATHFLNQGEYLRAFPHSTEALAIFRKVGGNNDLAEGIAAFQQALFAAVLMKNNSLAELNMRKCASIVEGELGDSHPLYVYVLGELGGILTDRKKTAEAEATYRKAIEVVRANNGMSHPRVPRLVARLLDLLNKKGMIEEGDALMEEALTAIGRRFGEDHPFVGNALVEYYFVRSSHSDNKKRIEILSRATEIYETSRKKYGITPKATDLSDAWLNQGRIYRKQKELPAAIEAHSKALHIHPKNASAWNDLGIAFWEQDKFAEAADAFKKFLHLDPNDAVVWHNLARSNEKQGKLNEAAEAYKKTLVIKPTASIWHSLGNVYIDQKKLREAADAYRNSVNLDPKLAGRWDDLADVLAKQKDFVGALAAYRKSVAIKSTIHRVHAAARAAVLGAAAKGKHASQLDEKEKARLRKQARDLLQSELDAQRKLVETRPYLAVTIQERLRNWQNDADLVSVRDAKEIGKWARGPAGNRKRQAWEKLWLDVEALRKTVRESYTESKLQGSLTSVSRQRSHEVKLSTGKVYVIDMQSKQFDTLLRIVNDKGKVLAENDDFNVRNNGRNSRIAFKPKSTRVLRLIATSYQGKGIGEYEILIRDFWVRNSNPKQDNPKQPIGKVEADNITGKLTAQDPFDMFSLTKKSRRKVHDVPLAAGKTYQLSLKGDFDTFLRIEDSAKKPLLYNDDVTPPGNLNSALIFRPVKKDNYRLVVTSFTPATGGYTLRIREVQAVGKPAEIKAELNGADKKTNGKYVKLHKIQLTAGRAYTIEMESKMLDTFLILVDSIGKRGLAQNDDVAPGNTRLSRIDFTPAKTATYFILATTYVPGQTGSYAIRVQGYQP